MTTGFTFKYPHQAVGASFMTPGFAYKYPHQAVGGAFITPEFTFIYPHPAVGASLTTTGLTQIVLLEPISLILLHKAQAMSNTLRRIFGMV